jgi:glycosyltransferase involved in cell wall biosynthesis
MTEKLVHPGISVVLPVHGNAIYLDETLRSIYASTKVPDEVLIIDDGIEVKLLNRMTSKFTDLRVIPNKGKGLVDALNTGIEIANYDLIARIDGDDCVEPLRYQAQQAEFRSDSSLVLLGSQVTYIDPDGLTNGFSTYLTGDITHETQKAERCLLAHPSVMFRRQAAILVGGYRHICNIDGVDLAEDFDMWVRLSRIGRVVNTSDLLTKYRQHGSQLSNQHRLPQEIATYYVRAVGSFENSHPSLAPALEMGSSNGSTWGNLLFILRNLGIRSSALYLVEILAYKKVIPNMMRRYISRILRIFG